MNRSIFVIPNDLKPKTKPNYSKPIEIGSFSYDSNRKFHPNRSELKYYNPNGLNNFFNSIHADLNIGKDKFISKPEDYEEHLDGLINSLKLMSKTEKCADFVTWRGIITKIICTPYKFKDSWSFHVMRRGKTIFIEDDKSSKLDEKKYPKQAMYSYWGHRFEHIIMTSTSDPTDVLEKRFDDSVNTWREFGVVFKSKLGGHRLIFGAEVDGLDEGCKSYVELKTSKILKDPAQYSTFYQQKLMSFWAQSFLAGIPKILIGFRSDRGIVKTIEYIDVNEIPRITRGKVTWCPENYAEFRNNFLELVSERMSQNAEDCVYKISFNGEGSDEIVLRELVGYPEFIPKDFKDAFYY